MCTIAMANLPVTLQGGLAPGLHRLYANPHVHRLRCRLCTRSPIRHAHSIVRAAGKAVIADNILIHFAGFDICL